MNLAATYSLVARSCISIVTPKLPLPSSRTCDTSWKWSIFERYDAELRPGRTTHRKVRKAPDSAHRLIALILKVDVLVPEILGHAAEVLCVCRSSRCAAVLRALIRYQGGCAATAACS